MAAPAATHGGSHSPSHGSARPFPSRHGADTRHAESRERSPAREKGAEHGDGAAATGPFPRASRPVASAAQGTTPPRGEAGRGLTGRYDEADFAPNTERLAGLLAAWQMPPNLSWPRKRDPRATDLAELLRPWSWVPDTRFARSGTTVQLDRRLTRIMNELTTSTLASRPAPAPAAGEAGAPAPTARAVPGAALDSAIARATQALLALQQPDGHWVFELEADCTIPAEYVLLQPYLGEGDRLGVEPKIAAYLKRTQRADGGWPLVHDGAFDISASVKAYFALKMIGEDFSSEPMRRAREAILAHGGAARVNVFTRALLALYGILRWRAVPVMPVEIMLLPRWFPFHLSKISYWARTVIVPLLVLQALKPRAQNPRGVRIDELFLEQPESVGRPGKAPHQKWRWFLLFETLDAVLRIAEPIFPKKTRRR